jgi:hypothetical protein
MSNSPLRTSLHALTVSFIDAVMAAIRGASLEDLLGEAPRDPRRTGAVPRTLKAPAQAPSSATQLEGQTRRQASPRVPGPVHRLGLSAGSDRVLTSSQAPPAPTAEITDPQGLLAMGTHEPLRVVETEVSRDPVPDGPASTVRPIGAGSPVRLRANETLARVSNAGIVIRRAK